MQINNKTMIEFGFRGISNSPSFNNYLICRDITKFQMDLSIHHEQDITYLYNQIFIIGVLYNKGVYEGYLNLIELNIARYTQLNAAYTVGKFVYNQHYLHMMLIAERSRVVCSQGDFNALQND